MSIYPIRGNIISHGRYPVNKLVPGQTIRFRRETVVSTIRRVHNFQNMIIVDGDDMNGVAFGADDYVELVTVEDV